MSDEFYLKSRRFRISIHQVKILHSSSRCAFDEIIEATYCQNAILDDANGDVAKVCLGGILGCRKMFHDPDEGMRGIKSAEDLEEISFIHFRKRTRRSLNSVR